MDYPARIVADPLPEDEPDGGDKSSRIFFRDPAQSSFDWSRETSDGGPERARAG
jgi:hypothetical protein